MGFLGFGRKSKHARKHGEPSAPGHGRRKRAMTGGFVIPYGACPKACRHTRANGCKVYRKRCADRGYEPVDEGRSA